MSLDCRTFIGSSEALALEPPSPEVQLVIASARDALPGAALLKQLKVQFPGAQLHLSTSCQGMMTEERLSLDAGELALITYTDQKSAFGSAGASLPELTESARVTAQLLHTAELRAARAGELPALVWLSATPGSEEQVIGAIRAYYKSPVLICGGSSADDQIEGAWWVGDQDQIYPQGIVLSLIYTSAQIVTQFSAGYQIADAKGVITEGAQRLLKTIDDLPAAEVYNEWCEGALSDYLPQGNILAASTFQPLAVQCGSLALTPYYRVIHPVEIRADGSLSTFSDIAAGEKIVLLSGDPESLISRARRVAEGALLELNEDISGVKGALVIFCAGCFLAIKDRIEEVWCGLKLALPDVPLLAQFTFGEQGVFPDGEVAHGNLMISVTLWHETRHVDPWFSPPPAQFRSLDEQLQLLTESCETGTKRSMRRRLSASWNTASLEEHTTRSPSLTKAVQVSSPASEIASTPERVPIPTQTPELTQMPELSESPSPQPPEQEPEGSEDDTVRISFSELQFWAERAARSDEEE